MSSDELVEESAEDLFEDAPCGYVSSRPDGTIVRVNRTFERWIGMPRAELVGRRFQDLLSAGGRIYHETHYAPLLHMQGRVSEIAFDLVGADGTRRPALVNSVLRRDAGGEPVAIRTTVFAAADRRRYEEELLLARDHERAVALALQRSLLTGELPSTPELAIGVAYRPGVAGLQVGGDWYDAFWLEEPRRAAVVVGDVVGRGIEAAATMGQLRSAIRALASTAGGPAAVLESLDAYVRRHGAGGMATVVYVELDVKSGDVCFACAGHPPPAVVEPGRAARFAWEGRSAPLDAFGIGHPRSEGSFVLDRGGLIVLYTDGVVERRDRAVTDGMDVLLTALDRIEASPRTLAAAIADEMAVTDEHADDVCVLTARMGAAGFEPATSRV